MTNKTLVFLLFTLLLSASCLKEPQKPSWDIAVSAPLFRTSIGIDSFFADSLLSTDSTQLLHIVYNEALYQFSPESILEVPDTITSQTYQSPLSIILQPGQLFLNKNETKLYKFGDAKLSFITVKEGWLRFEVVNSVKESIVLTYTISSAKKNGVSFEFTEVVPAATTTPYVLNKLINISGYTLDMRGPNGTSANSITTNIKARLNPDGVATQISPQDNFVANIKFDAFSLHYARGYFGSVPIDLTDSSKMDVFNIVKAGNFDLESLQISLDIVNGFGVDAGMTLNNIKSVNTVSGQSVPLISSWIGTPINVTRATETGNSAAPVNAEVYKLNFSNDNVKAMFENLPDRITFDINGQVNPMGNISGGNDFYYDGNGMSLMLNLDIPLALKANALTLVDTVTFDFAYNENGSRITGGTFHLIADNGFPFDATVQLYMLNEACVITDSLMFGNTIQAAPLNTDMKVSAPLRTIVQVPVPPDKLEKLYATKKMALKVILQTSGNQHLKIYSHYKIDLSLTGDFDFYIQQ